MPYRQGKRLPKETASHLGHLDVLKSDLVNRLVKAFEEKEFPAPLDFAKYEPLPAGGKPLPIVFGVDGSLQVIQNETPPYKKMAFVKTALLRLDRTALSKIDRETPHPFALRDIMAESALYHATVFPLKHVTIPGMTAYDAVRQIIYESIKDQSLNGEVLETLKWIAFKKWDGIPKKVPAFECPHCEEVAATLEYNTETGTCSNCGKELFLTDMLGFHQEMTLDAAPETVAQTYMIVHETLLLFTAIRYFWEHHRDLLSECLFVKDGPLSIRAQYSKLVNPIREFLYYAGNQNIPVHLIGQEKTGRFVDHLDVLEKTMPDGTIFIPGDSYIKKEIQQRPETAMPYGKDTNYGAKVFVKINSYHHMVLNIPTGEYKKDPQLADLIGADRIFATLPSILSNRYEGALLPIELANGIASLSTYPSAQILKIFSESKGFNHAS